ncbi:MAG: diguanylate cyclase [Pseudomonadota bacterium]
MIRHLLASLALAASTAGAAPLPLAFNSIDSLGSDSQSIVSLMQDKQGFVWIGTIEGGLFRYDGRKAVRYTNAPTDEHSLPGGRVPALYCDEQGVVWVGTDEGLARFDAATNTFVRYAPAEGPPNHRIVRKIISDGKDGMWLATWGGLQHFDPRSGQFKVYQHRADDPSSLAFNDINAVTMDDKGGVWIGTWPSGLDYLAPGAKAFVHYRIDDEDKPNPKLNVVRALLADSTGSLWIGTDVGTVQWKLKAPWTQRRQLEPQAGRITSIEEDRGGDIWISTRTSGIWRWDRDALAFQLYQHRAEDAHSLPTNAINSTMHDRTSTLWVGSFTDGVSRANLGYHGFERLVPRDLAPQDFKSSNFVRSIGAAPDGKLWLGVDDGVALFDPGTRSVLRTYQADAKKKGTLSHNVAYSLYQSPGGTLWVGTSQGLNRLDRLDGAFQVSHFGSTGKDFINAIAPGKGNVLWLGTADGLLRYDPDNSTVQVFAHDANDPGSRSVNGASAVLEDRRGRVWTGEFIRGGGLDVRDPASGVFAHLRHDVNKLATLSDNRVTCLHEDAAGVMWVGTRAGLNRVRTRPDGTLEVKRYTARGGVGKVMVEAIQSDRSGTLWVTTVEGLSKFDPISETATEFSVEDGLTEGFYINSLARGADGKLYFGSTSGISVINPAIHSSVSRPPQLAITGIGVLNRPLGSAPLPEGVLLEGSVTDPKSLTLPWRAAVLSIEFAALHFAEPKRNTYQYKLEGFDEAWVQADASHPIATYTNLAPGSYRFHLMGSNNKGVPARTELLLPITVLPPVWQTWWFRTLMGAAVLASLAALYRWRVRRFTARARELEALVLDRTSALQELNQKLAALSATDSLTGIANRRSFDDALAREWRRAVRRGETLAVAMLDVDFFKRYNDQYGHQAGDEALRRVAQVMAASIHRTGDLVARYGGEEFALIAPATSGVDAQRVAENMRRALEGLMLPHVASSFGRVTCSIGVAALAAVPGSSTEELVHAADQALYRAKSEGRNRVVLAA